MFLIFSKTKKKEKKGRVCGFCEKEFVLFFPWTCYQESMREKELLLLRRFSEVVLTTRESANERMNEAVNERLLTTAESACRDRLHCCFSRRRNQRREVRQFLMAMARLRQRLLVEALLCSLPMAGKMHA